ncbi:MAG TPA: NTP transferase domain-containing protein, partial [Verrucomicrobiae bacterium]|nr:NTP transferase domain-containing protein [Verrucomicrobiae bacterium]
MSNGEKRIESTKLAGRQLIVFILAGGKSSRMGGRDKSRLLLGNRTFLDRISSAARELNAPVEVIFKDAIPNCGPLGGVFTAFQRFSFRAALFLSCDMPLVSPQLLMELRRRYNASRKATFTGDEATAGFPFIIPESAKNTVAAQIGTKDFSIQKLAAALTATRFSPPAGIQWQGLNVNTPVDYRRALRVWAKERRSDAVFEVRNLTIRRGGTNLVSGFSWRVRRGDHWVVLGANGCGKTSLFSSLVGYLTPTRGDVFLFGEEYGESDWAALRKQIGFVSSSVRQMMAENEPAWITVASGKYAMIDFWGTPKKADKAAALKILRAVEGKY